MITEKEKEEFFSGFEVAYQILDYKDLVKFIDVFIDEKLNKLHQPTVISSVCDCDKKIYDPLMSGEVRCLRCSKTIAQTDL